MLYFTFELMGMSDSNESRGNVAAGLRWGFPSRINLFIKTFSITVLKLLQYLSTGGKSTLMDTIVNNEH